VNGTYPPLDRAQLAALIPHQGSMCLLDAVVRWDDLDIECRTSSHTRPENPLRQAGRIATVHLIEYGAQAMAIHGRLLEMRHGEGPPKPGVLVTVRDVRIARARIDDIAAPLTVTAKRLMGNPGGLLYQFAVSAGDEALCSGRVGVIHPDAGQA
jgi:predicted hotdog family 3-hydroxylacyl-ACP dehydratase